MSEDDDLKRSRRNMARVMSLVLGMGAVHLWYQGEAWAAHMVLLGALVTVALAWEGDDQ